MVLGRGQAQVTGGGDIGWPTREGPAGWVPEGDEGAHLGAYPSLNGSADGESTQEALYQQFMPRRVEAFLKGVNVNIMWISYLVI